MKKTDLKEIFKIGVGVAIGTAVVLPLVNYVVSRVKTGTGA